ncbi:hypothetical protein FNV43_RR11195 [Rhamnella rubrinervis]|uniref:Uncharacterized protein n=1 Tax=Rhamnella rubrinervis TaxID=2594499 RepID=A0A8K0MHH9_9ROSA|nr:hypothetical protein FNV43_RR11195 [Rhamnella rubrinervis]
MAISLLQHLGFFYPLASSYDRWLKGLEFFFLSKILLRHKPSCTPSPTCKTRECDVIGGTGVVPAKDTSTLKSVLEPNQVAEQNLALYTEPSARRDDPEEHRPRFFIQHPILIKTDIPSIFKPKYMSYLKESRAKKADMLSTLDDKPDFLQTRQQAIRAGKKDTSLSKESQFDPVGTSDSEVHSAWTEKTTELKGKEGPSKEPTEQTLEGIPLPIFEVPYTHVLEGCLRLLYGEPTDPLWASYPAINMGKMKVTQNCWYLSEIVIKANNVQKKRTVALNKLSVTNKSLEEEPTPEPSDDEEGDNDSSEISFEEDEAEDDSGGEWNEDIQPKDLPPAPEKSRSPTKDSFVEAMEAARSEKAGSSVNAEEVTSVA